MFRTLMTSRRFAPLFWCQFFSAFNDNFVRNMLVMLILFRFGGEGGSMKILIASMAFVLPAIPFSALGGEIADSHDKATIARRLKFAEMFVQAIGAAGFAFSSLTLLYLALFGLGCVAALFGPIKYGILPDHLRRQELVAGNALVEGATYAAIICGLIMGGLAAQHGRSSGGVVAQMMIIAVACYAASRWIPPTGVGAPGPQGPLERVRLDLAHHRGGARRSPPMGGGARDELVLDRRHRHAVARAGDRQGARRRRPRRRDRGQSHLRRGRRRRFAARRAIVARPDRARPGAVPAHRAGGDADRFRPRDRRTPARDPRDPARRVLRQPPRPAPRLRPVRLLRGRRPLRRADLRRHPGLGRRGTARPRRRRGERAELSHDGRGLDRGHAAFAGRGHERADGARPARPRQCRRGGLGLPQPAGQHARLRRPRRVEVRLSPRGGRGREPAPARRMRGGRRQSRLVPRRGGPDRDHGGAADPRRRSRRRAPAAGRAPPPLHRRQPARPRPAADRPGARRRGPRRPGAGALSRGAHGADPGPDARLRGAVADDREDRRAGHAGAHRGGGADAVFPSRSGAERPAAFPQDQGDRAAAASPRRSLRPRRAHPPARRRRRAGRPDGRPRVRDDRHPPHPARRLRGAGA